MKAGGSPPDTLTLTGTREPELAAHRHVVVEITGQLEPAAPRDRNVPPASGVALPPPRGDAGPQESDSGASPVAGGRTPSGAAGVTPRGTAAHEPGDATSPLRGAAGEVPPNAASSGSTPEGPIAIGDLPRVNVTAFRILGGACAEEFAADRRAAADAESAASAPSPQERAAATSAAPAQVTRTVPLGKVTVTGCVIRQASIEVAPASAGSEDALIVTRASVSDINPVAAGGGAVPGSSPSGSGTGTVPARDPAGRGANPNAPDALSFALEDHHRELNTLVGQRVSIAGTIRTDATTPTRPSAHTTAPVATLLVESFRVLGGRCD